MSALDQAGTPGRILVVDVGGTNVKFGLAIDACPAEYVRLFPTDALRTEDPVGSLAAMVDAVIAETGIAPDLVVSTVPGFLDTDEDRVLFAGNVQELNGLRLATELGARVGIPVILERDSVLALVGETLAGVGRGVNSVLGLFFGTGVGAAFIEGGRPFRGAGWALEIGHMPFKGEGRRFEGMRTDSLESYVSGRALQEIAGRHAVPIESVFVDAAGNAELGRETFAFLRDQAFAVGTAVALFSPEVIILGGGVCVMPAFPRDCLARLIEVNSPFAETGRPMDLRWAELGWKSVLHGAPHAATEHSRRQSEPLGPRSMLR